MALFNNKKSKQQKTRKAAIQDKLRAEDERRAFSFLPPDIDTGRMLLFLLFLALAVFLVNASSLRRVWYAPAYEIASMFLIVFGLLLAYAIYIRKFEPEIVRSKRRIFLVGLLNLAVLVTAKLFVLLEWNLFLMPVAIFMAIMAIVYSSRLAVISTFALMPFLMLIAGKGGDPRGPAMACMTHLPPVVIAIIAVTNIRKRSHLLRAGFYAAIAYFIMIAAVTSVKGDAMIMQALGGFANGLALGLLLTLCLPAIELLFGITTDIGFLELGDQNHPLIREIIQKAPGTYHHSLIVGNMCEAAAEAVGANALLARVAAYYHDIGKMVKPEYFVENTVSGKSKHDQLAPTMSALIITAHVKDGVEIAREYNLPDAVIDIIEQHHGTSLVEYFYREAKNSLEEGETLDESIFRYPGPRPATKEAAIVLLADSVEAASRILSEPAPARIETLVHEITTDKLMDRQLDDCNLTMKEIDAIKRALVKVLIGMFHVRIKYPDAKPPSKGSK